MHFLVTKIEFDFDEYGDGNPEWQLSQEEKDFITDNALGIWSVDDEEELVDSISDKTGWCIRSIDYQPNAPHSLTSFLQETQMRHLIPLTPDQLSIVEASLQSSLKYADSEYIELVDEIIKEIKENTRFGGNL